jgi:hypothetical protein
MPMTYGITLQGNARMFIIILREKEEKRKQGQLQ